MDLVGLEPTTCCVQGNRSTNWSYRPRTSRELARVLGSPPCCTYFHVSSHRYCAGPSGSNRHHSRLSETLCDNVSIATSFISVLDLCSLAPVAPTALMIHTRATMLILPMEILIPSRNLCRFVLSFSILHVMRVTNKFTFFKLFQDCRPSFVQITSRQNERLLKSVLVIELKVFGASTTDTLSTSQSDKLFAASGSSICHVLTHILITLHAPPLGLEPRTSALTERRYLPIELQGNRLRRASYRDRI